MLSSVSHAQNMSTQNGEKLLPPKLVICLVLEDSQGTAQASMRVSLTVTTVVVLGVFVKP